MTSRGRAPRPAGRLPPSPAPARARIRTRAARHPLRGRPGCGGGCSPIAGAWRLSLRRRDPGGALLLGDDARRGPTPGGRPSGACSPPDEARRSPVVIATLVLTPAATLALLGPSRAATSAGDAERPPGSPEGTPLGLPQLAEAIAGQARSSECPVTGDLCSVPARDVCWTQGEDKCPSGPASEPELQDARLKVEERAKPDVEAPEERAPRPVTSVVRPSHGPKRKPVNLPGSGHQAHARTEADLPLRKEEPEGSQSEPSPSTKHKKAKKRKNLVAPALSVASTVSTPPETLGLERKVQRSRPLYQYINYLNPELNQAEEANGGAETEVEPESSEAAVAPEEAGAEQLQPLLPVTGELGSGLALPCTAVPPTHTLAPPGEEAGEESGVLPGLGVSGRLKAEVDKSTQVDIDKMLSVCAAPPVPPLSPQYK